MKSFCLLHARRPEGFEALRVLTTRCEPRAPRSKLADLRPNIGDPHARHVEYTEPNLMNVEANMRRCEALAGKPLDDHVAVTVLSKSCLGDPRDRLETMSKDIKFRAHRNDLGRDIKRRRDTSVDGIVCVGSCQTKCGPIPRNTSHGWILLGMRGRSKDESRTGYGLRQMLMEKWKKNKQRADQRDGQRERKRQGKARLLRRGLPLQ